MDLLPHTVNATVSAFSTLSTLSHRPKHHTQSHKSTKPALMPTPKLSPIQFSNPSNSSSLQSEHFVTSPYERPPSVQTLAEGGGASQCHLRFRVFSIKNFHMPFEVTLQTNFELSSKIQGLNYGAPLLGLAESIYSITIR